MITKEYIDELKITNQEELYHLIQKLKDNRSVVFVLEHLGRLPPNFNGRYLIPLLQSKDDHVRFYAVKNIGKLKDAQYLEAIAKIAKGDSDSKTRREAVSSIGRMRSLVAIPFLLSMLDDPDPKVLLQAIRGLLVFKTNASVQASLKKLIEHPNEIVQYVIKKEFYSQANKSKPKTSHTDSPFFMKNVVVYGDVREILKSVPDESIHLTFTYPTLLQRQRLFHLSELQGIPQFSSGSI